MEINFKTFDLNLLRVMLAVGETGSISHSALRLGSSQPATSNAVARLRVAVGDPLFVRSRDGMIPTAYAERMLPVIKHHLEGLFAGISEQNVFDPMASERVFRLSLSGLGELVFLPGLLARTLVEAPHVRFDNVQISTAELGNALRTSAVDLAIGLLDINETGILTHDLFEDRYVVVAGRGLDGDPAALEDLGRYKLVMSVPGASYAQSMNKLVAKYGLISNVTVKLANFGALPHLLNGLPVISFLPEQFALQLSATRGIRILPMELEDIRSTVRLVWHEKSHDDPGNKWLRSLMIKLFAHIRVQDPDNNDVE